MKKYCLVLCLLFGALPIQAFDVIWDRSGLQDSSLYGYRILPMGDQNDDGYADWAVVAGGNSLFTGSQWPYVEFFHGGNPPDNAPYYTLGRATIFRELIFADIAGDVNGDHIMDWFAGFRLPSDPQVYHLRVFLGGMGQDTVPFFETTMDLQSGAQGIGDFNNDGFDDFHVFDSATRLPRVYYGGVTMDSVIDWPPGSHPTGSQAMIWACGDLNGDGASDYVGHSQSLDETYIFLGGTHPDTVPAYTWPNMSHWPLDIVNDLNGDSYAELVYYNCLVHYGRPIMNSTPDVDLYFPCAEGNGHVAASLGDINHDGYNDLALVREYCSGSWWGVLSLYLGHPWLNPEPAWTIQGRGWQNLVGIETAAGLGDVNGDGVDDFAIGAWDDDAWDGWRGRCIVVAGDSTVHAGVNDPLILHPSSFILSVYPNPFNSTTQIEFTLPVSQRVSLRLYDVLGREVAMLMDETKIAGEHHVLFDGSDLSSGMYFCRMEAGKETRTQKIVLMK